MKVLRILGWVFVPFIMLAVNWKNTGNAGRVAGGLWSLIIIAVLFIPSAGNEEASKTVDPDEIDKMHEAEAPAMSIEEQQEAVKDLYNQIHVRETSTNLIIDGLTRRLAEIEEGKATMYDLYNSATSARDASYKAFQTINAMDIHEDLPEEVAKLLKEAKDDITTGYYHKRDAFNALMKFMDNNKPSDLQRFEELMAAGDSSIFSGRMKLDEAKKAVGISEE